MPGHWWLTRSRAMMVLNTLAICICTKEYKKCWLKKMIIKWLISNQFSPSRKKTNFKMNSHKNNKKKRKHDSALYDILTSSTIWRKKRDWLNASGAENEVISPRIVSSNRKKINACTVWKITTTMTAIPGLALDAMKLAMSLRYITPYLGMHSCWSWVSSM